jgi:tetratricopeptide (TPR) repeat protein
MVGGHLLMAGQLIDSDPALAHQHAVAAKQAAPRLPIVREAVGETAYALGDYAAALTEFRAMRRMTGTDEYLPAMADCERALGRYQGALRLVREGLAGDPEVPALVELRLVEAGIRADTGQIPEALRLLQAEIESVGTRGPKVVRARLRYAYADLLEHTGQPESAERWFEAAASLDPDESTDAADRVARLRGVVIDFDESEEDFVDDEAQPTEEFAEDLALEVRAEAPDELAAASEDVVRPDGQQTAEATQEAAVAEDYIDTNDSVDAETVGEFEPQPEAHSGDASDEPGMQAADAGDDVE